MEDNVPTDPAEFSSALLDPVRPLQISIFGSLRIWRAGHETQVGAPRNRIVLAEIVAAAGNVVSVDSIVDALWGENPPTSATNQVHRIVGQLRRTFEPGLSPHAMGRVILAEGKGYRILGNPDSCELHRFRDLVRRGHNALADGETSTAMTLYETALEMARGPLFGGLDAGIANRPEFVAIELERVATAIAVADLALEHGATPRTLAVILPLLECAPFNELLHARLIRLLTKAGRRSEAIRLASEMRRRLTDELGVEPGAELRQAHHDIYASDPPTTPRAGAEPRRSDAHSTQR
jgi:DNA-binding SARP family transcriptional activator